jgi:hypothetical protein
MFAKLKRFWEVDNRLGKRTFWGRIFELNLDVKDLSIARLNVLLK